uniref:Peptidase A2 domain-containing protein n=1 Tax=Xenopus tropicalis TaxID=8364 RepID=A0A6I8S4X9_XENTR
MELRGKETGTSETGKHSPVLKADQVPELLLNDKEIIGMGLGGKQIKMKETKPVSVRVGGQLELITSLLVSDTVPVNLLGADILSHINAFIEFTENGVTLTSPLADNILNDVTAVLLMTSPTQPTTDIDQYLTEVPESLWAKGKYDIGTLAVPSYEKAGVLVKMRSPVNSPLFPVRKRTEKGKTPTYQMVHDLRAVNKIIEADTPIVPNPHTMLSQIPPSAGCFSIIDITNAYFSIRLDASSYYLFAFTFEGVQRCFTGWAPKHKDTVLLQYLLLCCKTKEKCKEDTVGLWCFLAQTGNKVSKEKLQVLPHALISALKRIRSHDSL